MKITYIQHPSELPQAIEIIQREPVLGIDTETTGFNTRVAEITLLQVAINPEEVFVINTRKLKDKGASFDFIEKVLTSDQIVVMQNGKFDIPFLEKLVEKRIPVKNLNDTMLASQLLAYGDKTQRHSLAVISERELGEKIDKTLQKSDFSVNEFSEEQIQYAADDASRVLRIREKHIKKISDASLKRCARLEFDAVSAIAEMESTGMYLDTEIWMNRANGQLETHTRLDDEIKAVVGEKWPIQLLWGEPSINLASPMQLKEALHLMGIPIPSTDEDDLKLYQDHHPVMKKILEYREVETAGKKFGETYLRFVDPVTQRIHASFRQIEAPTGRMSCTQPNLMQLPARGPYRQAFRAQREGGKIITADYSQIELRVMAYRSGDSLMTQAFINGEDLHNKTAHLVLGEPLENPNKQRRVVAKNLNFGTAYGTSPATFAKLADISEREAEKLIKTFWNTYSGLDRYLRNQGAIAETTGIMKTGSGRTGKLLLDLKEFSNRGRANRLGRNFGIQGTGADVIKTALYRFRQASIAEGLDARLINVVHDEVVVESYGDHEYNAEVLNREMVAAGEVYLQHIPCVVDIRIDDHWTK